MRTAIIDMGGGMRSAFGAGVYDYLIDNSLQPFDFGIGVSAGSANIATYIAGQRGRLLRFYLEYPKRKEYMSLSSLIRTGDYINLRYIYETMSMPDGEDPLDIASYQKNAMDMYFVATDAMTGKAVYFPKASLTMDDRRVLEASSAVPIACHPVMIGGRTYFDGGIADPLPYEKAMELGADRIVTIITKPKDFMRPRKENRLASRLLEIRYPAAGQALRTMAARYDRQLSRMKEMEKDGRMLIIAPDSTEGVTTIMHPADGIMRLYESGYEKAGRISRFLG